MSDRTINPCRKQMLKLMQQMNQLQLQEQEPDYLGDDFEIILDLNEDDEKQEVKKEVKKEVKDVEEQRTVEVKEEKLSENETIKTSKKHSCRVVFDTKQNTYACSVCRSKFKSLYNCLNHQSKFHNRKIKY